MVFIIFIGSIGFLMSGWSGFFGGVIASIIFLVAIGFLMVILSIFSKN